MPLLETDYCIEQINVPPKLPMILKQFCKSAIRTQPYDLLKWSSAYFRALANGEEPPTKLRLEYPPASSAFGLTIGFLKVLLRQLGADYNKVLPVECILQKWEYLCLDCRDSGLIISIGKFRKRCQIKKFLSIAVGLLTRSITETMIMICELFTHEPDGGSAMIPLTLFMEIYGYLAGLRCDGGEKGSTEDLCFCSDTTATSDLRVSGSGTLASDLQQEVPEVMIEPDSVASEDTHVDTDLELEFAKEEVHSEMTIQSFGEESEGSYRHEGESSFRSIDRTESSDNAERRKDEDVISASEGREEQVDESISSLKKSSGKSSLDKTEQSGTDKSDSIRNYPEVPGIGRRLLAEEVATVAIWMSECARRQGGMVGPRNVRHINCPPLEGHCCPRVRSCNDLSNK